MAGILCLLTIVNVKAHPTAEAHIDIFDDRALAIIDPDAKFSILGEGYSWSEGPLWLPSQQAVLFSDVPQNIIYKYKEGEGVSVYLKPSGATGISDQDSTQGANGLLLNKDGHLVIMQHGDRRVAIMDAPIDAPKASYTSLVDNYDGKRLNSPNDGVFHSNGDLYFTDPPYGLKASRNDPNKALSFDGVFRRTAAGKVTVEDKSMLFPNGIVLSNDESTVIVASSNRNDAKWYAYDVTSDGSLANRRVFYDVSELVGKENEKGLPDGMAVHSKGYIFATGPGGVFVFTEQGKLLAKIRTGKSTANCTLSADEKTLYMTAHDTLMSIPLN